LAVVVEAIDRSKASSPNDEKVMMGVAQSQMRKIPGVTHRTKIHRKTIKTFNQAFFNVCTTLVQFGVWRLLNPNRSFRRRDIGSGRNKASSPQSSLGRQKDVVSTAR
jgi:hypothetical protein